MSEKVSFVNAVKRSFCGARAYIALLEQNPWRSFMHFCLAALLFNVISGVVFYGRNSATAEALGDALQERFGDIRVDSAHGICPTVQPTAEESHFLLTPHFYFDYFDSDSAYAYNVPGQRPLADNPDIVGGLQWDHKAVLVWLKGSGENNYTLFPIGGPGDFIRSTVGALEDDFASVRSRTKDLIIGEGAGPIVTLFSSVEGVQADEEILSIKGIVDTVFMLIVCFKVILFTSLSDVLYIGGIGAFLALTSRLFSDARLRSLMPYRVYFNIIVYSAIPPMLCAMLFRLAGTTVLGLAPADLALYGMFIYSLTIITILQRRLLVLKIKDDNQRQ